MNTIISIETELTKVVKELKSTDTEDYETCDVLIREFCKMLVDAGWMPGSIQNSIIDLAYEYNMDGPEIM